MNLLILADDLTGAADSAARCHHAGLPAHVYLAPVTSALPEGAVAFSTDSRYLLPAAAANEVRHWLATLAAPAGVRWYKKIDSTLRGNIGAELDAMLEQLSFAPAQPCAVLCPAFPAQGRGLLNGCLVYAQAATPPLHLPTLLAAQTKRVVAALPLSAVQAGSSALAEKMRVTHQQGAQLIVVDAMTEADLHTLLAATRQGLPQALLCGSAGLIEPLARELATNSSRTPLVYNQDVTLRKPMLAVIGSGSQMAHRQLARLRQQPQLVCRELGVDTARQNTGRQNTSGQNANATLATTMDYALHLPEPAEHVVVEGETARQFVAQLIQAAVDWIQFLQPQTLLIVGGDTAVHLLHALGIQQLTIRAELMPGIPLALGQDARGHTWHIVTKAGNFGDEETLVRLFQCAK